MFFILCLYEEKRNFHHSLDNILLHCFISDGGFSRIDMEGQNEIRPRPNGYKIGTCCKGFHIPARIVLGYTVLKLVFADSYPYFITSARTCTIPVLDKVNWKRIIKY